LLTPGAGFVTWVMFWLATTPTGLALAAYDTYMLFHRCYATG
jgi:hypothetical protein